MFLILFKEICFNKYYRVRVLIYIIFKFFHFTLTISKDQSDLCETKAVLAPISLFLLEAASFCIYHAHKTKKRDTIAKSKVKILAKMSTRSIVRTVAKAIILLTKVL